MKCETVMILWHNKDPIYSVDFDPTSNKFCTTGFDNEVKIWGYTKNKEGHLSIRFLSSLTKHIKPVNIARFSPGGNLLASGSDDGSIVIWKLNGNAIPPTDSGMKEIWSVVTVLRVTTDVYDLSWSSDGQYLSSVSTDNSVSIWSPLSKIHQQLITEHSHYVQGVSWDPLNDYMITQSSDGTCRVYRNEKKKKKATTATTNNTTENNSINDDNSTTTNTTTTTPTITTTTITATTPTILDDLNTSTRKKLNLIISNVLSRRSYNNNNNNNDTTNKNNNETDFETGDENNNNTNNKQGKDENLIYHKMFYDERASTFFRRPTWSPDGSLFITPTGKFKESPTSKYKSTSYIFSRHIRDRPLVHLPSNNPTVVVKFSPIIYKLRNPVITTTTTTPENDNNNNNLFNINYRMIFAISSQDTICVYDTQKTDKPIAIVSNLHYSSITDISWSCDGSIILITSSDGFCSYISFSDNELGEPLPELEYSESLKQCILYKQRAIINTTINEQQQQSINHEVVKNNLKRKNNSGSSSSTTTNGEQGINSTDSTTNTTSVDENENEQTKKQKIDEDSTTSISSSSPSIPITNGETSTTTTTNTTNGETKPKRRIQPNLINK